MNKEKKNKGNILLIVYALCALAAFIAEIYFMINYKKEYVIIIAIGLVFLTSMGFMLEELFDSVASKPVDNSMEELLKVQKAAYLQGKNLTEELNRLFEDGIDSMTQAFEDNTKAIIDNEKNIAKVIIKRNDDSNEKIRAAVEEIDLSKIPVPEISMPEINIPEIKIPEIKLPEMSLPEMSFPASDNHAEIESAKNEIISLIEKLSEQVKNSAKMEDIIEIREMLSKGIQNVDMENMTELVEDMTSIEEVPVVEEEPEKVIIPEDFDINAENTFEDLFKDLADEIVNEPMPDMPVMEEMSVEDMPLIMEEMTDETEPTMEESVVQETVSELPVIDEPVVEDSAVEEVVSETSVIDEPVVENPNKQLSADEIAALFASIQ